MFNTGKKDNPKPPGAPRVSPAARSAVISTNFEDISSTLSNFFPEREIGDQPTVLWVESTSQEISTEKDESQVESKPQLIHSRYLKKQT